ncbi:MAG: Holliday junction ATP-dependent DNA helicase RuvA [Candidatus Poribacteria bacterium]|nr:Holliday junction ATP-dependent DNA helicase RuvA [Candidatus Poribacteria bacterium]
MIAFVKGILEFSSPQRAVVEVNDIGYSIEIPSNAAAKLPDIGSEVKFYTYHHCRENEIKLFGFTTRDELKVFEIALTVKGIGPSLAQNIVSKLSPVEFQRAVRDGDHETLTAVPRLNEEMAQLIIIKLKNAIGKIHFDEKSDGTAPQRRAEEGIKAIVGLGASENTAEWAMAEAQKALGKAAELEELIRLALRYISKRPSRI